jgi:hypothetical protein
MKKMELASMHVQREDFWRWIVLFGEYFERECGTEWYGRGDFQYHSNEKGGRGDDGAVLTPLGSTFGRFV